MEEKECWEINPGCGDGGECNLDCPSYAAQISCWRYDWKAEAAGCPEEERPFWRQWMEERCPRCPVWKYHETEMRQAIAAWGS